MNKNLNELKKKYEDTPIPSELDSVVNKTIRANKKRPSFLKYGSCAAACFIVVATISINASPALASALADVPVLAPIVRVLNFRTLTTEKNGAEANVKIAKIEGLENKELEETINKELLTNGEALMGKFNLDVSEIMADVPEDQKLHYSMSSDFEVKTSNEDVFSLAVIFFEASGSSNTEYKFYNVNQKTGDLITLDSLFKSDSNYVSAINEYLISEMKASVDESGKSVYWVNDDDVEKFQGISETPKFYINSENHIVIAFDKYEVAAGYIGNPEFELPSALVAPLLSENAPIATK